ncbi:ANL family adenylate-forming protein [Epilithonimonas hungarica]|uniref:AMP-binding enzyme C-terminal domain-containing protein n=1 Tax=Epilithonimonas hungarica TaxID=454006 RepID=A0A1G7G691_9FLAO|nr:fatty acid--CoA ligase family protein [Epilithonimonas hungarica]MPT30684.1 long-chain fatty acid--CoA ligase [Chryseobacterium sp.]SDE83656.1 AMP-binding enzyme C-terminal domain-containing protein [Epilithonimonas hungarica]
MFFLIDRNFSLSYEEILQHVNSQNSYIDCYIYPDLRSFFLNWIFALVNQKSIALMDSDISEKEILSNDLQVNQLIRIENPNKINSVEELINSINNSTSQITLFTSGTTGFTRKFTHPLKNLIRKINISDERKSDVWGFAFNPTHVAGVQVFFQAILNQNLLVNVFLAPRDFVINAIDEYKITNLSSTPTFYRLLLPLKKSFDSVKKITVGGEKSDSHLISEIGKAFPNSRINNVYGSTETGPLFSSQNDEFFVQEKHIGLVKVVDDELYIHKDLFGKTTQLNLIDDFYPTGDLIEWTDDEQRKFRFTSRKNELINVGGYKVNPYEVEDELTQHSKIRNVRVYGKANAVLGNVICCEIELHPGSELKEEDIRSFLNEKIQNFKIPRKITFVNKIELTRTGKKKIV